MLRQPAGALAEAVSGLAAVSMLDEPWPPREARINRFPAMVYCGVTMITDGHVALLDGSGAVAPRWTVFGPRTRPVASLTLAPLRCVTVLLYPDAFRLLTGCEPARLKDRNEPGEACLPAPWQEWPAALQERACDPEAQFAWMEQWLLRRWLALRACWNPALGALVRGSAMADGIQVGQRQLQRQALAAHGLTPAKAQRLRRAQLALARLAQGHALAPLAADLGFADQSHLTRDICDLTGLPPARLATAVAQDPAYWAYRLNTLA